MTTHKTEIRPDLVQAFEKAGLDISLRTFVSWARQAWQGRPQSWEIKTMLRFLDCAQLMYDRWRLFGDDEEPS